MKHGTGGIGITNPADEQIGREESDPQISQIPADSRTEDNHESTRMNTNPKEFEPPGHEDTKRTELLRGLRLLLPSQAQKPDQFLICNVGHSHPILQSQAVPTKKSQVRSFVPFAQGRETSLCNDASAENRTLNIENLFFRRP